jgi:hypothetical protein
MSKAEAGSIQETGADALDVVEGMTAKNQGLLLCLKQLQNKCQNGSLKGRFEILDEGTGYYAEQIRPLVGRTMNSKELVEEVLASLVVTRMMKLTIVDCNSLRKVNKRSSDD